MSNIFERSTFGASAWFWAWLHERVLAGFWWLVPLSLVISFAGGLRGLIPRALVAMFALVTLRLMDDIEDVKHDRRRHPERVLCRVPSLRGAYRFCGMGLGISCLLISAVGGSWFPFVVAIVFVFVASRFRQRFVDSAFRVLFAHVILLKVPVLVVTLARDEVSGGFVLGRALALCGFVGAYEVFHDPEARRSPWAPFVVLIDMACVLLGLAIWLFGNEQR